MKIKLLSIILFTAATYCMDHDWRQITPMPMPSMAKDFASTIMRLRGCFEYIPQDIQTDDNKPIIMVVIHGTGISDLILMPRDSTPALDTSGPRNNDFFHPDNYTFKNILSFGRWYADKHNKKIHVLSIEWSGQSLSTTRLLVALCITMYLQNNYPTSDVILLSHSHGCNIANIVTRWLINNKVTLIHFGCPVREAEAVKETIVESPYYNKYTGTILSQYLKVNDIVDYTPINFQKLIYFFSTSDYIAPFGAINEVTLGTGVVVHKGINLVDTTTGNMTPKVIKYGAQGVNLVTTATIAVASSKKAYTFSKQPGKVVIGLRTQIDGVDTDHSNIILGTALLPDILTQLEERYPCNSALSSSFDINFDTVTNQKMRLSSEETLAGNNKTRVVPSSLTMSIREAIHMNEINDVLEDLPQEQQAYVTMPNIISEQRYSDRQASTFRDKYHKRINNVVKDQHVAITAVEKSCCIQ